MPFSFRGMTSVFLLLCCFMGATLLAPLCLAAPTEKHILFLSTHTPDYPGPDNYQKGLKNKLSQVAEFDIQYSYEYVNFIQYLHDEDILQETADHFAKKYSRRKPDVIVTLGPVSEFLNQYGPELFRQIPTIQMKGMSGQPDKQRRSEDTLAWGLEAEADRNIQLILQTRPLTKSLVIILGNSDMERHILPSIRDVARKYADRVKIEFLTDLTQAQMLDKVQGIDGDGAIFFFLWLTDADGRNAIPETVLGAVTKVAKVPVYALDEHCIGNGMTGGYVRNWERAGENDALFVAGILKGDSLEPLRTEPAGYYEYAFDWRQLQRWGIKDDQLPAGSKIKFREYTFWELYKGAILGSIALIIIETVLIIGLLINRRRLKEAYTTIAAISERLQEEDKRKDIFLSNTAHEIKTPLHGILNITQAVLEETSGSGDSQHRESLSLVLTAAQRLDALVNDILDFEKIRHNEIRLHLTAIDVRSAVDSVFEVVRHIVRSEGVSLVNRVASGLPPAQADENRLRQILLNLIGNAVKFTASGEVAVTAVLKEDRLHISIWDTGIGIPENKQEAVFHSFEQVSAGRADQYGGNGLGLAITRQLVERMGGEIWVAWSELGQGTEMTFTLPVCAEENAEPNQPVALPGLAVPLKAQSGLRTSKAGEFTLLAVDDDPTNLRIILQLFDRENYDILTAASGQEALRLVQENRNIDLVLLDVMMPGLTGYEVCRQLRQKYSLFELPVLLVTVRHAPEDVATGFAAGANDFIVKPFAAAEVRARVRTLLALKKAVADTVRAEVAFLQSQIKPHFFYNALNTIASFCYTDSEKAGNLLVEFSNYLRRSFAIQETVLFTELANELDLVKSYVAIEQARFGDRVAVVYAIDEQVLKWQLPPLTVQPLVENAVRHGITAREEGGCITITARREGTDLIIQVIDDGVGLPDEKRIAIEQAELAAGGVGLRNIRRRLLQYYGRTLCISSQQGQGTTVEFRIPRQCPENVQIPSV